MLLKASSYYATLARVLSIVMESLAVFQEVADTLCLSIFSSCSNSWSTSLCVLLPREGLGPIFSESGLNVMAGYCELVE